MRQETEIRKWRNKMRRKARTEKKRKGEKEEVAR